jgi:hypothetical protein
MMYDMAWIACQFTGAREKHAALITGLLGENVQMKRDIAARWCVVLGGLSLSLGGAATAVAAGPSSAYWITDGDSHVVYKIQGGAVVQTINTPANPDHEYPIAVTDTEVRTFANLSGQFGREYTPAGVPTGGTYTNFGQFQDVLDGTTDGVNYNYAFIQSQGTVVRYDRIWSAPQVLFTDNALVNDSEWGGITCDSSDNTLWINRRDVANTVFNHYALDGSLIGSFSVPVYGTWGLAYDRGTDSLWFLGDYDSGVVTPIHNISKTGQLLETVILPVQMNNPLGGEMAIPEPAGLSLLALCGTLMSRRRRR